MYVYNVNIERHVATPSPRLRGSPQSQLDPKSMILIWCCGSFGTTSALLGFTSLCMIPFSCIYFFLFTHTHTHARARARTHARTSVYIHTHIDPYIHHTLSLSLLNLSLSLSLSLYIYIYIYIHTHTHTHTYTYIYIYMSWIKAIFFLAMSLGKC